MYHEKIDSVFHEVAVTVGLLVCILAIAVTARKTLTQDEVKETIYYTPGFFLRFEEDSALFCDADSNRYTH